MRSTGLAIVLIRSRIWYKYRWTWTAKWPLFCIISPNSCTMSS